MVRIQNVLSVRIPPLNERSPVPFSANPSTDEDSLHYAKIQPIFKDFGFTPPSGGVIARDLSEKIEKAIIQHCESFSKGNGHCDLARFGQEWEVKICKDSGLTINQSKVIKGENYIVVNYKANSVVRSIWVLWNAEDRFFSPRIKNSNARSLSRDAAAGNIEAIFEPKATTQRE